MWCHRSSPGNPSWPRGRTPALGVPEMGTSQPPLLPALCHRSAQSARGIPPGVREAPRQSGSVTDSGTARGTCPGLAQCGCPSESPNAPVPRSAQTEGGTVEPAAVCGQRRGGDEGFPQPTRGHGSARTAAARRHCPVPAIPRPRGEAQRIFGRPRGTTAGPPRRRSPPHGGTRSSGAAAPWCPRRRGARGPPDGAGLRVHPFAAVPPASPSRRCRFRFCSAAGAKARPGRTQHRRSLPPLWEPPAARRGADPAGPRPTPRCGAAPPAEPSACALRVPPPRLGAHRARPAGAGRIGWSGARSRRPRAASASSPRPRTRAWSRGASAASAAARGRPAGLRDASGSGGAMAAAALQRLGRAVPRVITGCGVVRAVGLRG